MAKMSKASASHQVIPGYVDAYEQEVGAWAVGIETNLIDMDLAPMFKGAPDDSCQASHLGYVLKGKFGIRKADGEEEVFEAGDAFVIEPGHTPIMFAGAEYLSFTPADEAREQEAVMMPNVARFAAEHGIELPAGMTSS
jgi:hypothetical protein